MGKGKSGGCTLANPKSEVWSEMSGKSVKSEWGGGIGLAGGQDCPRSDALLRLVAGVGAVG
jgi:hypothetical protein